MRTPPRCIGGVYLSSFLTGQLFKEIYFIVIKASTCSCFDINIRIQREILYNRVDGFTLLFVLHIIFTHIHTYSIYICIYIHTSLFQSLLSIYIYIYIYICSYQVYRFDNSRFTYMAGRL